jgi:hypothetical protein
MLNHTIGQINTFENMNFIMYLQGIKYLKSNFYVSLLMNYHNMICVLHLNKNGLGNIEL